MLTVLLTMCVLGIGAGRFAEAIRENDVTTISAMSNLTIMAEVLEKRMSILGKDSGASQNYLGDQIS
jgi:hypothetical protein